jgi:hypothetical protein
LEKHAGHPIALSTRVEQGLHTAMHKFDAVEKLLVSEWHGAALSNEMIYTASRESQNECKVDELRSFLKNIRSYADGLQLTEYKTSIRTLAMIYGCSRNIIPFCTT